MFFHRKYNRFAILFCGTESVHGLLVHRSRTRFAVSGFVSVPIKNNESGSAMRTAVKQLGSGRDCITVVSGPLPDGVFLGCRVGKLSPKYLYEALQLELSNRLLKESSELLFQYAVPEQKETSETIRCNLYAFNISSRRKLEAVLMQGIHTADHYIYPLMGLSPSDPAVYLPEIEKDFYYSNEEWQPVSGLPKGWLEPWKRKLDEVFDFPAGFELEKYLPLMLIARFMISPVFSENIRGLNILPKKLHTGRYRNQLLIMGILTIIFALNCARNIFGTMRQERTKSVALQSRISAVQRDIRYGQARLKRSEKEMRELGRIVELSAGEPELIKKLALLSKALPKDVMIVSFRLSESGIDLIMRTEQENLNLQNIIHPLNIWKVSSVRQFRRGNETAGTIMAKLISAEESEKTK